MQEKVQAILANSYGLHNVALQELKRAPAQTVFRVDAAQGRFILKCYAVEGERLEALARSEAGNARAAASALPVAPIVPNREGAGATKGDDTHYVVYRHIDGRHHDEDSFTRSAAADLGRVIGRLQRAFDGFDHGVLRSDHRWPMDVDGGRQRLTAMLREVERGTHPTDRRTAAALRSRIEALERLADEMCFLADLPLQWVHGDCNPGNFLFDADDRVVAVLDFDNLSTAT